MSEEKLDKIINVVLDLHSKVENIENGMATKQEMTALEDKLLNHIDGFIKLHETLDQELVSLGTNMIV